MPEPKRFVLLHHVLTNGAHWDLMLDAGEALATWQIGAPPEQLAAGAAVPAQRLADHRRAYLDYEGPVSGNRGQVTRTDAGAYETLDRREDVWVVRLGGSLLKGTFRLQADGLSSEGWTIQRLSG